MDQKNEPLVKNEIIDFYLKGIYNTKYKDQKDMKSLNEMGRSDMVKFIYDCDDNDIIVPVSPSLGVDLKGNAMVRVGDNVAVEVDSGEVHVVSSWKDEE